MLQSHGEKLSAFRLTFLAVVMALIFGCAATVPDTARVRDAELPDYKVGGHRVEEAVDLHIESQIRNLRLNVKPRSDDQVYHPIPVVVGPSLEKALLSMTRQHFANVTTITEPGGNPTLSYRLLAYKPVLSVVPGFFTNRLNVSARLALQVSIHAANGEQLFSTTAIGTSHVSDTKFSAGDDLKDGPRLLEVATRDAIIDAMYDISSIFGNSSSAISDDVRISATSRDASVETMDDVILHLRTWHEETVDN